MIIFYRKYRLARNTQKLVDGVIADIIPGFENSSSYVPLKDRSYSDCTNSLDYASRVYNFAGKVDDALGKNIIRNTSALLCAVGTLNMELVIRNIEKRGLS